MVKLVLVLALLVLGAVASPVRADNANLVAARAAIEAVKYDEAQASLVAALQDGGNSPAAVQEIYRLSASVAAVLGRRPVAEQYYQRWLALDPNATVSTDLGPKLREPFISAQAYMNAHGRLQVKATRRTDVEIDVVVEADPLAMAVAIALEPAAPGGRTAITADHHATVTAPAGAQVTQVVVLDEFGNHLLVVDIAAHPVPDLVKPRPAPAPVAPRAPSIVRSWRLWAISAGALVTVGLYFGLRADADQLDLETLTEDGGARYYTDFVDTRDRRDRNTWIANGAFIAGGACAITSAVMFVLRPRRTTPEISAIAQPGGGAVSVRWAY